jgi:two-component system nitrate/nitrite response regulator NarL
VRPIIVIDDHELAHSGIRLLLTGSDEFVLAGCFTAARAGVDCAAAHPGAIVLLDLEMPDIDGLSALSEIISRAVARVVILTGVTEPTILRRALDLGAHGIVCKGDPIDDALAALRAVAAGGRYLSQCASDLVAKATTPPVELSERQHAILQLLTSGCSNKEISYRLAIKPPTVSFHLAEIRRRLNAENSRQLVDRARAAGIVA